MAKSKTIELSARSRSPPQQVSRSKLPVLKAWVLVRPPGARRWSDATPALVSKVTTSLQATDARITVLVPNLLCLKHAFGGRAFKEVHDLKTSEIKPYAGGEHAMLKEALLRAIRDAAVSRKPSGPPAVLDEKPSLPRMMLSANANQAVPLAALAEASPIAEERTSSEASEHVAPMGSVMGVEPGECATIPMTPEASLAKCTSNGEYSGFEAARGTCVAEGEELDVEANQIVAKRGQEEAVAPAELTSQVLEPAPLTPVPRDTGGLLERHSSDDQKQPIPSSLVGPLQAASSKALPPSTGAPSKHMMRAITAAVASAFTDAGGPDVTWTREELFAKIAQKLTVTAAEFDQTLESLDKSNKIFISGELVFAV
eukprot:TRINITY_DN2133_c0_g1_i2.p1 TRINITY_DN2133_c0_g1~~TRINITY_DN2133_c0_g1_i2.p1  ORF type:complete len:371 (-),score=58.18 TRINITY_DN2133_c0_g1_i2:290-1402(-)